MAKKKKQKRGVSGHPGRAAQQNSAEEESAFPPSSPVIPPADPNSTVDMFGLPITEEFWADYLKDVDLSVASDGWGQPLIVTGLTIDESATEQPALVSHKIDVTGSAIEDLWGVTLPREYAAAVAVWEREMAVPGSGEIIRARNLHAVTRTGYSATLIRTKAPGQEVEQLLVADTAREGSLQILRRAIGAPRDDRAPSVSPWEAIAVSTLGLAADTLDPSSTSVDDGVEWESVIDQVLDVIWDCQRLGLIAMSAEAINGESRWQRLLMEGAARAADISWAQVCASPEGQKLFGLDPETHPLVNFPNWGPDSLVGQVLYYPIASQSVASLQRIAEHRPDLVAELEEWADAMCGGHERVTRTEVFSDISSAKRLRPLD